MQFRKKPVVIEAWPWDGDYLTALFLYDCSQGRVKPDADPNTLLINMLEGTMRAQVGDWIIKGVAGEWYPCKPDIFTATYEVIDV